MQLQLHLHHFKIEFNNISRKKSSQQIALTLCFQCLSNIFTLEQNNAALGFCMMRYHNSAVEMLLKWLVARFEKPDGNINLLVEQQNAFIKNINFVA